MALVGDSIAPMPGRGTPKRPATHPVDVEPYILHARKITKRFRNRNRRSLAVSGAMIGLSSEMLSHWETGPDMLSLRSLLAHALTEGVPLPTLFAPLAPDQAGDILEVVLQLSDAAQAIFLPMMQAVLTAELEKKARQSGNHEPSA